MPDMAAIVVVCSFAGAKAAGRGLEPDDIAAVVAVRSSADGIGLCVPDLDDAEQADNRDEQVDLKGKVP